MLLACGIDPKASTLFVQGHVAAHSEATWLLNCVTPIGWLERMTQYKDKSSKQESISTGLFDYPVLMAADILLYDADEVPVGEDQKQHVELTRDIAERFNRLYGETFVVPEPVIPAVGARVMGLDDPTVKMSKSYSHIRGHAVRMLDEPKEIERSIMRAVTDSGNEISFSNDPAKAGVNNLLGIYKAITGKSVEETEHDFTDARGYGDLKRRVAEVVIAELTPIRERHEATDEGPGGAGPAAGHRGGAGAGLRGAEGRTDEARHGADHWCLTTTRDGENRARILRLNEAMKRIIGKKHKGAKAPSARTPGGYSDPVFARPWTRSLKSAACSSTRSTRRGTPARCRSTRCASTPSSTSTSRPPSRPS